MKLIRRSAQKVAWLYGLLLLLFLITGWSYGNYLGVPLVTSNASGQVVAMPGGYNAAGFPGQSRTFADLYYNRYRDFDGVTGRYIQADPIGLAGGPNPYSYAMGNPTRYMDPTGECPWCAVIIVGVVWRLVDAGIDYSMQRFITGITDGVTPANSISYAYDVRGWLNRVSLAATSAAPYKRTDYAHDANGNRTAVERRTNVADTVAAQTDSYIKTAGTNRLASISTASGIRSITPDARGNTASETRPGGITVSTGYDGHGRLISYSQSGTISLAHSYNGLGDRTATTATPSGGAADTRRFVTAPDGRIIGEYGTSATDVKAEFIWLSRQVGDTGPFGGDDGLGGYMPIAMVNGTTLTYVHGDHLGTPIVMTDATGAAIAQPSGYYATAFPGQSKTLADLYYNRYRDYDPTTGRYIQADPIGLAGGSNAYLYGAANPVRYIDPTGEFVPLLVLGAVLFAEGYLFDVGMQYFWDGKDLNCIDQKQAALSGGFSVFGGGVAWTALKYGPRILARGGGAADDVLTKGAPKPSPKFQTPTNKPQLPPEQIPPGWKVWESRVTEQYPDKYWKLLKPMKDGSWQPINPSTMKPGPRPETHVPFPPK